MKNHFYSFPALVLFILINIGNVNAQQVDAKIQEVYGDKTQELVQEDQARLNFLTDFLNNRVKIIESELISGDKYPKLSSVSLLNKYNMNLLRDTQFDPLTFNPLKYNFPLSSRDVIIYRVDNTDYLIVIHPQTVKKD